MSSSFSDLPLVYSCSGCSNAAQLANALALHLDRAQCAEMSCISGVGGGVAPLVRLAQSGRPILALDGCPLACAKACLAQAGVSPSRHVILSEHGVRKRLHTEYSADELAALLPEMIALVKALKNNEASSAA